MASLKDTALILDDLMVSANYEYIYGEAHFAEFFVPTFMEFIGGFYKVTPDPAAGEDDEYEPSEQEDESISLGSKSSEEIEEPSNSEED